MINLKHTRFKHYVTINDGWDSNGYLNEKHHTSGNTIHLYRESAIYLTS